MKISNNYEIYKIIYIVVVICSCLQSNTVLNFHINHSLYFEIRTSILSTPLLNESLTLKI